MGDGIGGIVYGEGRSRTDVEGVEVEREVLVTSEEATFEL